jgi:hypothetical protein
MAIPFDLGWSWLRLDRIRFSRAQLGTQLGHFEGFSGWFWRLLNARKPLKEAGLKVVPGGGIEPSTHGFSERSAQPAKHSQILTKSETCVRFLLVDTYQVLPSFDTAFGTQMGRRIARNPPKWPVIQPNFLQCRIWTITWWPACEHVPILPVTAKVA